jgi:hypothetical protein
VTFGWLFAGVAIVAGMTGILVWSRRLLTTSAAVANELAPPAESFLSPRLYRSAFRRDWVFGTPSWARGNPEAEHALRCLRLYFVLFALGVTSSVGLGFVAR